MSALSRRLPRQPVPGSGDARAAWHLSQAARSLALAEQAWDDPPKQEDET